MVTESVELAGVYISLVPSLRGAPEVISKALGSAPVRKATDGLGDRMVASISKALGKAGALPGAVRQASANAAAALAKVRQGAQDAAKAADLVGRAFKASSRVAAEGARHVQTVWSGTMNRLAPGVTAAMAKVRAAVTQGVSQVAGRLRSVVDSVSTQWSRMTAPAVAAFSKIRDVASQAAAQVASHVTSVVAGVGSRLQSAVAPIGAAFMRHVGAPASSAFNYVRANVMATGTVIGNTLGGIQRTWASAWAKMPEPVRNLGGTVRSALSSVGSHVSGALGGALAGAVNVAASAASRIGSTIHQGVTAGVNLAKAAVVGLGAAIATNLGGGVARADLLTNFPRVMANIGYSAEDARLQVERISNSLDGLPTSTDALVRTVQGLAPITGDLSRATDVALALNNALLAGGGDTSLVENALEQYRQMMAVGTVDRAAWRSVVNAMPGQMDQVARSMLGATANSEALYAALKEGTVSFDDLNNAIVNLNSEGVDGLASFEQQARTATGGIGTSLGLVSTRIKKALASIIEAIGVDAISQKINDLTSGITGIGTKIAEMITRMKEGGGFASLGGDLAGLLPVIGGVAGALGSMLSGLPLIGGAFSGITGPVGILVGLLGAMWSKSETLRAAVGGLFETLSGALTGGAVTGALESLTASFGQVATVLGDSLGQAITTLAPVLSDLAVTVLPVLGTALGTVMEALAPIAGTLMTALADAVAVVVPPLARMAAQIVPVLAAAFSALMAALTPVVSQIAGALVSAVAGIMPLLEKVVAAILPVIINLVADIVPVVSEVLTVIADLVSQVLPVVVEVLGTIINAVLPVIVPLISAVVDVIGAVVRILASVLVPLIQLLAPVITTAVQAIGAIFMWLWDNAIGPIVGWITDALKGLSDWMTSTLAPAITSAISTVKDIFQGLWDKAVDIGEGIKSAFQGMSDSIGSIWDNIKSLAAGPINFVIRTVYTDGIKKLVDGFVDKLGLDLSLPSISPIPGYASGGVLPGYTPGRDVYTFHSVDGGGSLRLSGGEAIMRPEWVRAVGGPRVVDAMNAAAAGHRRVPGGDVGRAQAFKDGGIWDRIKDTVSGGVEAAGSWLSSAADAVASIISDPIGAVTSLIRKPVDVLVGMIPGTGAFAETAKAVPGRAIDAFGEWLKGATASMSASDLVSQARLAIGTPYVWGGVDVPGGVDCSGLIVWALRTLGYNVPRHTASSFQAASIPGDPGTPGNLLYWGGAVGRGGAWHVAVSSGNGMMVEAPNAGSYVRETPIWGSPSAGVFKYDEGGWLHPGNTLVTNQTGKPEAVLTNGQWSKLDALLDLLTERENRDLVLKDVDDVLVGRMRVEADNRIITAARYSNSF